MKTETILGLGALVVLVVFIVFAFRKGLSVKPTDNPPPRNDYT
jgi:hypothetical protein